MNRINSASRENREGMIFDMMSPDINSVLDIGCGYSMFKDGYDTITLDFVEEADIKQDLNNNQTLDIESNSFDIVVMNQILEHLTSVHKLVSEAKRVSKRYIFVGLPNEITFSDRVRILFGVPRHKGYDSLGHKHFFTIDESEKFINKFFGGYSCKRYWGAFTCASFLPGGLRDLLARSLPGLFAGNIFYVIDLTNGATRCKDKANSGVEDG